MKFSVRRMHNWFLNGCFNCLSQSELSSSKVSSIYWHCIFMTQQKNGICGKYVNLRWDCMIDVSALFESSYRYIYVSVFKQVNVAIIFCYFSFRRSSAPYSNTTGSSWTLQHHSQRHSTGWKKKNVRIENFYFQIAASDNKWNHRYVWLVSKKRTNGKNSFGNLFWRYFLPKLAIFIPSFTSVCWVHSRRKTFNVKARSEWWANK